MKLIKRIFNCIKVFIQKRKQRKLNKNVAGSFYIDSRNKTDVLDVDLISDELSEKEKKSLRQTTKLVIWTLLIFAIIWISWSYVLSTIALVSFGNAEPLSDLSQEVCRVIIGTTLGYMAKSFVETFAQKTSEMIERHWNKETKNNDEPMG